MLNRLHVTGFKSLRDATVEFAPLTVVFGPNAAGKSNLLDAVQVLSLLGTARTVAAALEDPAVRGRPAEAFALPAGGLAAWHQLAEARLELAADLALASGDYRYRVEVGVEPAAGQLRVTDERLTSLTARGESKRLAPRIGRDGDHLRVRQRGSGGHPYQEQLGLGHTLLSDGRFAGDQYPEIVETRAELAAWRVYYLDPRTAMRQPAPPREADDIGPLGADLAPFLNRLQAAPEHGRCYQRLQELVRYLIPAVSAVQVELDQRRGVLDLTVVEGGVEYSSRVVSEGTLRVLALCALAVNPWRAQLVGYEEPENGVHPRRLEQIANLLLDVAESGTQVILTTHSPLLVRHFAEARRQDPDQIRLLAVHRDRQGTSFEPFDDRDLFLDADIDDSLSEPLAAPRLETALARGWFDA
ncbi:MAG: AAA family ATPase [Fimbriimonadaceae bacterium]|nr:AAA family ATPase [Fimbriimonadaceae bacterium]